MNQPTKPNDKMHGWVRGFAIFFTLMAPIAIWKALRNFHALPEVGFWDFISLVGTFAGAAIFAYVAITGRAGRYGRRIGKL